MTSPPALSHTSALDLTVHSSSPLREQITWTRAQGNTSMSLYSAPCHPLFPSHIYPSQHYYYYYTPPIFQL